MTTPMYFAIGFIAMFTIGGLTGVTHSAVPADYQQNDTYYIVAHFHQVLFGGAIFGIFAGIYYWFPKFTGSMLNEGWGKVHFWLMLIGFNLTFQPMMILGMLGMPRRIQTYPDDLRLGLLERDGDGRRLRHRRLGPRLHLQRHHAACATATRPATTRGTPARSSGPSRRRRPSTTSPRSRSCTASTTSGTGSTPKTRTGTPVPIPAGAAVATAMRTHGAADGRPRHPHAVAVVLAADRGVRAADHRLRPDLQLRADPGGRRSCSSSGCIGWVLEPVVGVGREGTCGLRRTAPHAHRSRPARASTTASCSCGSSSGRSASSSAR